jgi:DNA-binding NtrC family response regulator
VFQASGVQITLAKLLRDRKSDIPLIAEAVLRQVNADFCTSEPGYEDKRLSGSAKSFLQRQPWPGNIRQLQNVLVQAAIFSGGPVIPRGLDVSHCREP